MFIFITAFRNAISYAISYLVETIVILYIFSSSHVCLRAVPKINCWTMCFHLTWIWSQLINRLEAAQVPDTNTFQIDQQIQFHIQIQLRKNPDMMCFHLTGFFYQKSQLIKAPFVWITSVLVPRWSFSDHLLGGPPSIHTFNLSIIEQIFYQYWANI